MAKVRMGKGARWMAAAAGCLAVWLVGGAPAQAVPVAQWHFDEAPGTGTAYDSVGSVDGVLNGAADFAAGGIAGNCVSLDRTGNGFVDMGDQFGFTSGDFSIVAWAKTAPGDQTYNTYILSKHHAGTACGYVLGINTDAGGNGQTDKAWFYVADYSPAAASTTSVNDGNWHQVVGVFHAGGSHDLYVDGEWETSMNSSEAIATDAPLLIGGVYSYLASGLPEGFFTGLIDEVQLYDHALSDTEVGYLYEHPTELEEGLFCVNPPAADLDGDCRVNLIDLALLAGEWLNCGLNQQDKCW